MKLYIYHSSIEVKKHRLHYQSVSCHYISFSFSFSNIFFWNIWNLSFKLTIACCYLFLVCKYVVPNITQNLYNYIKISKRFIIQKSTFELKLLQFIKGIECLPQTQISTRFTTLGCKDIRIRKSEFVSKTQLLRFCVC